MINSNIRGNDTLIGRNSEAKRNAAEMEEKRRYEERMTRPSSPPTMNPEQPSMLDRLTEHLHALCTQIEDTNGGHIRANKLLWDTLHKTIGTVEINIDPRYAEPKNTTDATLTSFEAINIAIQRLENLISINHANNKVQYELVHKLREIL